MMEEYENVFELFYRNNMTDRDEREPVEEIVTIFQDEVEFDVHMRRTIDILNAIHLERTIPSLNLNISRTFSSTGDISFIFKNYMNDLEHQEDFIDLEVFTMVMVCMAYLFYLLSVDEEKEEYLSPFKDGSNKEYFDEAMKVHFSMDIEFDYVAFFKRKIFKTMPKIQSKL